ncbi:metallophosphoesterase [Amycolatopsis jiangsuensis]|uniref:3',5'-cyclic AMP phosphodiesterase CpdA n=1 Tax=Amycolatopsis jiangsuensis TaxID=1181879 RepID=A0A840IWA9_9PSEU|nr:metallophosphoesterase [Amycolatopsis jiangsuensis]MBB4685194.1 3',5'-cyclic AMP phosphodiesterase CpdA [Amycolatopsis jiangsuensis]
MRIFAQLSDLHLDGGDRADARAAAVLRFLHECVQPVDAVLVTGDIADHGLPEEYRRAAELLEYPAPVVVCPGNHDVRAPFREGLLGGPAADGPVNTATEVAGVLIAACDSSIPGHGAGYLADETLSWLDEVLAGHDGPALVAFHHPPVEVGIPLVDRIRQTGEDRLAAVLRRHPGVAGLLCGHVHTGAATTFAGVPVRIAPGVVSGSLLPIEPGSGRGWDEGGPLEFDRPPSLLLHVLHDDGRLTTHHRVVTP